jgi:hypothetical protein
VSFVVAARVLVPFVYRRAAKSVELDPMTPSKAAISLDQ